VLADRGIDDVFGESTDEYVGHLAGGSTPQFMKRFPGEKRGMRCSDHAMVGEERVGQVRGFWVEHVQGEAPQAVAAESVPDRGVVNQAASGGVDHYGMVGHQSQCVGVEHLVIVVGEWQVQ
jgi:hypothetical protein